MQTSTPSFSLATSRLLLRTFSEADLDSFLAYRNDPDVARYQSWEFISRSDAEAFILQQKALVPGIPGKWFQIAITHKEDGQLVGDCGVKLHQDEPRIATIGITMAREHQGKGFAREALAALFEHLFAARDVHRIIADTDPRNIRAWSLFERLGMRREAHFIQSLWFKGTWADEYVYAILKAKSYDRQGNKRLPRQIDDKLQHPPA